MPAPSGGIRVAFPGMRQMSLGPHGTRPLRCGTKESVFSGNRIQAASEAVGRLKRYDPITERASARGRIPT